MRQDNYRNESPAEKYVEERGKVRKKEPEEEQEKERKGERQEGLEKERKGDRKEGQEKEREGERQEKRTNQTGTLYLCATPIGNLEDITLRVLRVLREADLIAAEDTRNSIRLLNHFDIHTPLTSYHEYTRIEKARALIARMQAGANVALITDAGTPGISDPGEELVRLCLEAGVPVTSLPGACACVTALTVSGLSTRRFCFEAFLPQEKKERQQILEELRNETRTIVIYEAPHRLTRTLLELLEMLGDRRISVCRELTKKHETIFRTTLSGAVDWYTVNAPRGECVLVLEGRSRADLERESAGEWESMSPADHVAFYEAQGLDRKAAMKQAAKDRGVSRREIYAALLEKEGQEGRN